MPERDLEMVRLEKLYDEAYELAVDRLLLFKECRMAGIAAVAQAVRESVIAECLEHLCDLTGPATVRALRKKMSR